MIPHDPEDDLRRQFKDLRAELERSAPPFHALWRRALSRAMPRAPLRRLWFATACLLSVAGLMTLRGVRRPPTARTAPATAFLNLPPTDSLDIIHWRPPTGVLLKTPGAELLTTTFHPESNALPTHVP